MLDHIKLSWSSMLSFMKCQRRYELGYIDNLQKIPSADSRNVMLGSAFHAGVQNAIMTYYFNNDADLVAAAAEGVRQYVKESTIQNKLTYTGVVDTDYYAMVREVEVLGVELVRYHVPIIGIGAEYLPASMNDVLNNVPPNGDGDHPVVEYHFAHEIPELAITITGYIDTVLWDVKNKEYVIIDWKTRGAFPYNDMAVLDGQLHLYAAILNAWAERVTGSTPITRVIMYQCLTKTPSPASVKKGTSVPNTGATSYSTTWEVWKATLPAGVDWRKYEKIMKPKLKTNLDFQQPIAMEVTRVSSEQALRNAEDIAFSIRTAQAHNRFPAILSSDGCKFCDFAVLCANSLRYGGDGSDVIKRMFQPRRELKEAEIEE